MAEAFSLKDDLFNRDTIADLAEELAQAVSLDRAGFVDEVCAPFPKLELKERMAWIATCLEARLPDDFLEAAEVIRAALPTALFALGGVLVAYRPEGDMRVIAMICAISLLIHPAITFGMGAALNVPAEQFRPAVLTSAMAPGVNTYIFANMYGAAKRVAASSVLLATMASVVSVWVWLLVLP